MGLHIQDLDFADTIISTNIFLVRQGGSVGEDRQATVDNLKTFMLSDTTKLDLSSPLVETSGDVNIIGDLTINGTPITDYVNANSDNNYDDLYFRKDYITAVLATKAPLVHNHDDLYYPRSETYSSTEVDTKFDDFQTYFSNNLPVHNHDTLYYRKAEVDTIVDDATNAVDLTSGGTVAGDLAITGDLSITGTTTTINTQTVAIDDNVIEINSNQTGTPPTILIGGLEINRGDETNYQLIFAEQTQTFNVGQIGNLQPVATRETSPMDNGYAVWNDGEKRFDTQSITAILEIVFPVGFIYTQFPQKPSPADLGYPGTWTQISGSGKDFNGTFFRAEGTNANPFEGSIQNDAIIYHTHTTNLGSHSHGYSYSDGANGSGAVTTGSKDGDSSGAIYSTDLGSKISAGPSVTYASETRPTNWTVRIWERTA